MPARMFEARSKVAPFTSSACKAAKTRKVKAKYESIIEALYYNLVLLKSGEHTLMPINIKSAFYCALPKTIEAISVIRLSS